MRSDKVAQVRRAAARGLLALGVTAALASCGPGGPTATADSAAPDATTSAATSAPVVRTTDGAVRGTATRDGLRRFQGIPFAAPPVGSLRWRPPQPAHAWTGVRDATRPGPVCVQPDAPEMPSGLPQSEDCLTLNVTAPRRPPEPGKPRPVLVWMPGGGFVTGAGSVDDPSRLVKRGDMVVVTLNYRLGVFGFFAHPRLGAQGNFGLQDQLAALRWVHANIARFGGDPGRITLGGVSAGAMSTCTLMTSPRARGLFRQAIVQSGSCLTDFPAGGFGPGSGPVNGWQPLTTVQRTGRDLADRLGCRDVTCLRRLPARELVKHQAQFSIVAYGTNLVPRHPAEVFAAGKQTPVPLLQGTTRDEHVEFALGVYPDGLTSAQYRGLLRDAFGADTARRVERRYPVRDFPSPMAAAARMFSDRSWTCPAWRAARLHARTAPTYSYLFDDEAAIPLSGHPLPAHVRPSVAHGADVPYLFDSVNAPPLTAAQRRLATRMVGYWARFVRSGDPNGPHATPWPRMSLTSGGRSYALDLAPGPRRTDLDVSRQCGFWLNRA
ncbi:carboxylesterase/lipase family protein [Streptomyces sp. NPDC041068]|uniref:carboxylesterase/lipase family protein n=1 Tax=Streptomyces sp. NPDC041068 TaxID=3155130 RepID=UPI0033C823DF